MNHYIQNQGILPPQLNLDLLTKVYPILLSDYPNEAIVVTESEYIINQDSQYKTYVFTDSAYKIILPKTSNIGLQFKFQNNTTHDCIVNYTDSLGNNHDFIIHPEGLWLIMWDGDKWVGYDLIHNIEIINSETHVFSPAISKLLVFNSSNDVFKYVLPNGLNAGIEMTLLNNNTDKNKNVYVYYYSHGKYRKIWLPPLQPYFGKLKWDGNQWLNITENEWVVPVTNNTDVNISSTTYPENEYLPEDFCTTVYPSNPVVTSEIYKDVNNSTLHVVYLAPRNGIDMSNTNIYIPIDTNEGCIVNFILDDRFYSNNIDDCRKVKNAVHMKNFKDNPSWSSYNYESYDNYVGDINSISNIIISKFDAKYNVSLSSVIRNISIIKNNLSDYFKYSVLSSSEKTHLKNISISKYSCTGFNNDIIIDLDYTNSVLFDNLIFNFNISNNETNYIPINSKITLRNNSNSSINIKIVIKNYNDSISDIESYYSINSNNSLELFYNGYNFIVKNISLIGLYYSKSNNDRILTCNMTNYIPDYSIKLLNGTRLQMVSKDGVEYHYTATTNVIIEDSTLINPSSEMKSYYVYWIGGYSENIYENKFILSDKDLNNIEEYLQSTYNSNTICYMLIGGFDIGYYRKTNSNYIPLDNNNNVPGSDWGQYATQAWVREVYSNRIIPNSVWDLSNRPKCYNINNPNIHLGGMVKVSNKLWVDIYQSIGEIEYASFDENTSPIVNVNHIESSFEDIETINLRLKNINYFSALTISNIINKRLLTRTEYLNSAQWTPSYFEASDFNKKFYVSSMNVYGCSANNLGTIINNISYDSSDTLIDRDINGSIYYGTSKTRGYEYCGSTGAPSNVPNVGCRTIIMNTKTIDDTCTLNNITYPLGVRFCSDSN